MTHLSPTATRVARAAYEQRVQEVNTLLIEHLAYADNLSARVQPFCDLREQVQGLQTLRENLGRNRFELVVVGEFSNGKSTFINALMRRKILPSKAQETTATINYIRHVAEHPQRREVAEVYFRDKHTETIHIDDIERYVTVMSETYKVSEDIDYVEIFVDSPYLQDGVVIVDTPGLEGMCPRHDVITTRQIERSNACIFLFDGNHPGKNSEFPFLQRISHSIDRIFFVANRCDTIKTEEETVESVMQSIVQKMLTNVYYQVPVDRAHVYPVSAYQALSARDANVGYHLNTNLTPTELESRSGLQYFEERLEHFLFEGEKVVEALRQPLQRMDNFYNYVLNKLDEQLATVRGAVDLDALQRELSQLKENIETRQLTLQAEQKTLLSEVQTMLDNERSEFEQSLGQLSETLKSQYAVFSDVGDYNERIDWLTTQLVGSFRDHTDGYLRRLRGKVLLQIQDKLTSGTQEMANLLNFQMQELAVNTSLREYRSLGHQELQVLEERVTSLSAEQQTLEQDNIELARQVGYARNADRVQGQLRDIDAQFLARFDRQQSISDSQKRIIEQVEKRRRGGWLGWIAGVFVGDKEVVTRVANPRIAEVQTRIDGMEQEYLSHREKLQAQYDQLQDASSGAEDQREEVKARLTKLERQYEDAHQTLLQRKTQLNEKEVAKVNQMVGSAILEIARQVKAQYQRLTDSLEVSYVIEAVFAAYQRDHDAVIAEMSARMREREALLQKNANEKAEIEQLLADVSAQTVARKQELAVMVDRVSAVV